MNLYILIFFQIVYITAKPVVGDLENSEVWLKDAERNELYYLPQNSLEKIESVYYMMRYRRENGNFEKFHMWYIRLHTLNFLNNIFWY